MKSITVFYANRIHLETDDHREVRALLLGAEIYNGGYMYINSDNALDRSNRTGWYTCDFCPVLIGDVPKELRALVLLLG
jgi:hypothetical protein